MAHEQGEEGKVRVPRTVEWYMPTIPTVMFSDSMRRVLREYSGISDDQVEKHIYEIRDKAWDVFPYPCIGRFTFLQLSIGQAPQYDETLTRVKAGERLLDIGCNFGQDLRKLVYDGAPSENLYGSDLADGFFSLGYELFNDRKSLQSKFIAADALAPTSALDHLNGTIDIIHASSFFHLFDRERQIKVGVRCVKLLQQRKGALIFGRQAGCVESGEHSSEIIKTLAPSGSLFRHNVESWRRMWDEIASLTGTKWRVEVYLYDDESSLLRPAEQGRQRMRFAMWME